VVAEPANENYSGGCCAVAGCGDFSAGMFCRWSKLCEKASALNRCTVVEWFAECYSAVWLVVPARCAMV